MDAQGVNTLVRCDCHASLCSPVTRQACRDAQAQAPTYGRDVYGLADPPPWETTPDPVNHPPHYTAHPSGIECIQVTEHMGFCLGSVVKYIWRADLKGNGLEDLRKARWYLDREIANREARECPF